MLKYKDQCVIAQYESTKIGNEPMSYLLFWDEDEKEFVSMKEYPTFYDSKSEAMDAWKNFVEEHDYRCVERVQFIILKRLIREN